MSKDAKVWTVGELLRWTEDFLAQKGIESARLDAQVLLAHALNCQRIQLYTRFNEVAEEEPRTRFRELVRERVAGSPVAYLVGHKEFYKLDFDVSPDVLIPRPATETLVLEAIHRLRNLPEPRFADIGTGSGCIPISVTHQIKTARAVAVDLSPAALAIARRNAAKHGVADRIEFREGDLLAPLGNDTFHAILSNPPYIARPEIPSLAKEVREFEPRMAIDGGDDGLGLISRIFAGAARNLEPGGWLILEVGRTQAEQASQLMTTFPEWKLESVLKDGDGIPRVLVTKKVAG